MFYSLSVNFTGEINSKICNGDKSFCISIHSMGLYRNSWQKARHGCKQIQANLLEIDSRMKEDFIYNHTQYIEGNNWLKTMFWIGAKNYEIYWSNGMFK